MAIMAVAGLLIGPLVEAAKCGFPYIRRKLDFLLDYKKTQKTLDSQLAELTNKKADIERKIDCAEKIHQHEATPKVAKWLENVAKETQTTTDWEAGNQKCFMGLCLNWQNRYKLNKELKQKVSEVRKLIAEEQRFEQQDITTLPLPPPIVHKNIEGFVETDSARVLMQKIRDLLANESVKGIGIWGMGGAGKTTLVKNLNNQLESDSIFHNVIFLTISHNPDWKKLQKEIAEKIGLTPPDYEDVEMRAQTLSKTLGKKKSVLFILDDVWTHFDLSLLGISDVKYKFIITTRDLQVCNQMEVGKEQLIELRRMSEEDSWKLFRAKAGDVANLPHIEAIANELCRKCGGSPLAICTFAAALKGDDKDVSWKGALTALSSLYPSHLRNKYPAIFTSVEFSFERLSSNEVKLCFLYSCSNGKNECSIEDMRIYGISRKLISGTSLKEASQTVRAFVEELRKRSLLVVDEDEKFVTMHDIIRQVAIDIASNKYGFVVKSGQQLGIRDMSFDSEADHISLSNSKISKLPNVLCCPSLLALDMSDLSINDQPEIHEEFFAKTSKLQYLDISRTGISNVPNSIWDVIHLCTLDMRGLRNLSDISSIGKLECLEILILDDTGIEELPKELGNLGSLKMLHLKNTRKLKTVAPDIFSRLQGLQELNMENSFSNWEIKSENGDNACLGEVFGLSQLTTLHLDIYNSRCLEHDYPCAKLSNLEKFRIVVACSGDSIKTQRRFMRYLSLFSIPLRLGNWICKLFAICEYLNLMGSSEDVVETLPYHQIIRFNCLTELKISNLGSMKHVIDCDPIAGGHGNDVFPSLEQLVLKDMDNLESINGSVRGVMFSKLTSIQIDNCENIHVLFTGNTEEALQNVTEIQIHRCGLIALTDVKGPNCFQKLKKIEMMDCGKVETMLAGAAKWECLETISVTRCINLAKIFDRPIFPENLKHVTIKECRNLISSVSALIQQSFSSIEKIEINGCNPGNVGYLLSTSEIDDLSNQNAFENLRVLKVNDFDGEGIFNGPILQCSLQKLEDVSITNCNSLTSIWGSCQAFEWRKPLTSLTIGGCDKLMLKEIFHPKNMSHEFALRVKILNFYNFSQLTNLACLPQATLQHVEFLTFVGCQKLKYLLSHRDAGMITRLKYLLIEYCSQLENIILQDGVSNCDLTGQAETIIREEGAHINLTCTSETTLSITNFCYLLFDHCSRLDLEKLGITNRGDGTTLVLKGLPQLETLAQLQSLTVGQRCGKIQILECENFTKLYSYEDAYILKEFHTLVIYDCPKLLTFICEEEMMAFPRTQPQGPIKAAFTQSTFRNLKSLFIGNCHNLKYIFSLSIARSMACLESISVVNCDEMSEIVALSDSGDSEVVYADLFPCLRFIELFWLYKLECFCKGYRTPLHWLSLKTVIVWECPNLVTFAMGPQSAPNLKIISGQEELYEQFEKDSSFYFRFSSLFRTISYPDALKMCSNFDSWTQSTAYTSKVKERVEGRKTYLRHHHHQMDRK